MYAVYHGAEGLKRIAQRVNLLATTLAQSLEKFGHIVSHQAFFATIRVELKGISSDEVRTRAAAKQINLRYFGDSAIAISLDETVSKQDLADLISIFSEDQSAIATCSKIYSRFPYSQHTISHAFCF